MEGGIRWAFNTRLWRPSASEWSMALSLVQAEEKDRISRFMFRRDAKSALAGRLLLRKLANDYLNVPWGDARFGRSEHGRPRLMGPQSTDVDFNVSHQGAWAVLAAERGVSVGCDVMELRPPPGRTIDSFLGTMRRQFTSHEWGYVRESTTELQRLSAFYRLWCLKESVIKAKGDGLTYSLLRLSLTPGTPYPATPPAPVTLSTTLAIDGTPDPMWHFQESMLDQWHPVAVAIYPNSPAVTPKHFTVLTFDDLTSHATPLTSPDLAAGDVFIAKSEEP